MSRLLWLALLAVPHPALADDVSITARAIASPSKLGPGDMGVLAVEIDVPAGWHLWALDPGEGPQPLAIVLPAEAPLAFDGPWHGPTPKKVYDKGFQRDLLQYQGGETLTFERAIKVGPAATAGALELPVNVRGQICTEEQCLSQRLKVPLKLELMAAPLGLKTAAAKGVELAARGEGGAAVPSPAAGSPPGGPKSGPPQGEGLFSFLLLAFLAGLGALATPCVFPAIPLTVSFFSKFASESVARGARLAAFYAVSMVACFTAAGVLISVLVGATGVQRFAAHPVFNLALATILVVFSLNLLGMFEIKVPSFLLSFTNNLEGRFGPNARGPAGGGGLSDYVAVGVAAMTSTTVFFTCTVAFVGVVVVAAAQGEWFWPTVGMLAFSSAFVLPFFLLALFPQAARRLRGKSGSWLVVTRVTLGFIELAAALKFFSNADLVLETGILSRDAALALWVPLFLLAGAFLLGKLRFGEEMSVDEGHPISVPRMLTGAAVLSFSLYLALGLFTGRPMGWIDGWLPPGERSPKLAWLEDLKAARTQAARDERLVFTNYTGFTCTNCRYMESTVFSRDDVTKLLGSMVLVELYTDGQRPVHDENREDQIRRFGTAALPFYAVERPDGTVVATFPSSTNHPEEFRRFLEDAIAKAKSAPAHAQKEAPPTLRTTLLTGGEPFQAISAGKWSLVNFWASWCAPCREELEGFMVDVGRNMEARGGRFLAVTIDDDADREKAQAFLSKIALPAASQLAVPASYDASTVDPRLGFKGNVPFTALIDPDGRLAWSAHERLDRATLEAVLAEHLGYAALR